MPPRIIINAIDLTQAVQACLMLGMLLTMLSVFAWVISKAECFFEGRTRVAYCKKCDMVSIVREVKVSCGDVYEQCCECKGVLE